LSAVVGWGLGGAGAWPAFWGGGTRPRLAAPTACPRPKCHRPGPARSAPTTPRPSWSAAAACARSGSSAVSQRPPPPCPSRLRAGRRGPLPLAVLLRPCGAVQAASARGGSRGGPNRARRPPPLSQLTRRPSIPPRLPTPQTSGPPANLPNLFPPPGQNNDSVMQDCWALELGDRMAWRQVHVRDDRSLLLRTAHSAEPSPRQPQELLIWGGIRARARGRPAALSVAGRLLQRVFALAWARVSGEFVRGLRASASRLAPSLPLGVAGGPLCPVHKTAPRRVRRQGG
jgi:hypothetical protein